MFSLGSMKMSSIALGRYFSVSPARVKIYRSATVNPFFNLATEDWLFRSGDPTYQTMFLWRNEPTVVIGKHQNPWKEARTEMMEQKGIHLARRQSGGGAVYQDLGNSCFTFMGPREEFKKEINNSIICRALSRFGITAEVSGRNDLIVDGRKVSGSAYKMLPDRAFHHGTLLLDVDLNVMVDVLNPSKAKLESKGIDSVRSRVVNMSSLNPTLTHDTLGEALVQEFLAEHDADCKVEDLDHDHLAEIPELKKRYEELENWEWRFGKTPKFTHVMEKKFDWANIEVCLRVKDGLIVYAAIFTDALTPDMIDVVSSALFGVQYTPHDVSASLQAAVKVMSSSSESSPEDIAHAKEFSAWLVSCLAGR
eukprot:Rmarinus@m.3874